MEILLAFIFMFMIFRLFFKIPKGRAYRTYKHTSYTPQKHKTHNQNKHYKQKGDKYEVQIGRYYQNQGYKVYFKGINEGFRDKGIDLIAYKDKEVILIQCKNWENSKIKQEHLRIFLGDCIAYIEQNPKLAKRHIRRVFVTSCESMDYGVKKFIAENSKLEYKIIPYQG